MPPRSISTPASTNAHPGAPTPESLRKIQTQPMGTTPAGYSTRPPQKKRHSITGGLKKAYAMSQKNAYTKFATAVAVGTVGVAIGTDLSGILDGLDAFDFDSSSADGANTGSDFTGNDQVPSGSGLSSSGNMNPSDLPNGSAQATEWMQQQTWQNVTLPNAAGPSFTPAMMSAI